MEVAFAVVPDLHQLLLNPLLHTMQHLNPPSSRLEGQVSCEFDLRMEAGGYSLKALASDLLSRLLLGGASAAVGVIPTRAFGLSNRQQ